MPANKTPLGYSLPLAVRVLTPVHIGGTDILSPMADYYLSDNQVHLIDSDRFSELLVQKNKHEDFIRAVERISDEKKTSFLKNFCQHHLKWDLRDIPVTKSIPAIGIGNPTEINQCIKTDGQAYLPGSSLKGAIRSAILFHWLTDASIPEAYRTAQAALDNWWTQFMKHHNDVNMRTSQKVREITKAFAQSVEETLFGRLQSNERLPLSSFKLNDSEKVQPMDTAVYSVQRYNLNEGTFDIPVVKECISPDRTVAQKINLDYDRISAGKEQYNTIIKPLTDPQYLFNLINNYSLSILNYELDVLDMAEVVNTNLGPYCNKLADLQTEIQDAKGRSAYLRLGQGKMMFYQTIGLALFEKFGRNEDDKRWIDYLSFSKDFKSDDVPTPFPVTRALTVPGQQPMGWVELSMKH